MAHPTVARHASAQSVGLSSSDLMAPVPSIRPSDDPRPDQASDSIIRSKVQAPVVRDSTLARGRLLGWLDEHAEERVRVLAAEAGYGKTTLLADWARRTDRPVRWLKLDPTDAEWTTFISYLVAAFQEGAPEFGHATQRLLAHVATLGATPDQTTSQLLGELGGAITEPTALIIDDLQHVDGNDDVRRIIERLIERAPEPLTFILSGRHRPDLRLARLTAQGRVISLGTEDLRFTRQETGDLFASAYHMPLDGDLVSAVDSRTEGWGASLQLLYSSIRSQRPAEVREFISGLAGSQEPLYDFLAEEVLDRQSPLMQRVLVRAAILDRIVPALVVAALAAADDPPSADAVVDALDAADELGLMSRNAPRSSSRRFHPLLREFLTSHLRMTTPAEVLQQMHLRVAKSAESIHWPTSAHHYIEAGEGQEAMRVISDATINALGSGSWGAALELVARIPDIEPSVPVQVIRARGLVAGGQAQAAVLLLEAVQGDEPLSGRDRALVRLALANALANAGRMPEVAPLLAALSDDPETPTLIATVARAWREMDESSDIVAVIASMRRLASLSEREGLHFYAALAHHNAALLLLATAQPETARSEAALALGLFASVLDDDGIAASTRTAIAHAAFDMGDIDKCIRELRIAQTSRLLQPDVFAESAMLLAWLGSSSDSSAAISHGWKILEERSHPHIVRDGLIAGDCIVRMSHGDVAEARRLAEAARLFNIDPNQAGLVLWCQVATGSMTLTQLDAVELIAEATAEMRRRGIERWLPPVAVADALVSGDVGRLEAVFSVAMGVSDSTLLVAADVIGYHLDKLTSLPERLDRSVRRWPDRWRPVLRRTLRSDASGGNLAAHLLAEVGEERDVELLDTWERRRKRPSRDRRLSVSLARRVCPTLRILDLGRASILIANRKVMIAGVRRKAASLLLFLVSRPKGTATREQVFDALWPDLDSEQAANSLHQTLYFLRRELVVRPNEGRPIVEYVPVESEIIYLDPDLVHVESAAFARMAEELSRRDPAAPTVVSLLQSYQGKFAPEFEYDDWAIQWRDQVHSAFLVLTEQAARVRLVERAPEAAAVLRHALEVDPEAIELKPLLAAALHISGSREAARQLHDQYAEQSIRDYGDAPPSLRSLLLALHDQTARPPKPPQ